MAVTLRGARAILLPGTGSDDDYLRRAFGPALTQAGVVFTAHRPCPDRLVAGYLDALDEAAAAGAPIVVGGVSLGAAVAAAWAIAHPGRALAVLAALPPWLGASDAAPAAAAARATAATLRRDGLDATVAELRATSPAWLADELTRSWTRQWPGLPEAMEAAADYTAPTAAQLGTLATPMGVAGSPDDPVHPVSVARQWAAAAPHAALRTVALTDFGADPSALGATALAALAAVESTD